MFFPFSYWLFFMTLILGSLMAVSSPSWFSAWIGLELNLMSFIPLITTKMSSYFSETALKYFLIQALGSTFFITASFMYISLSYLSVMLILLSLLLKLGSAPFHFWFPHIMEGLYWPQVFIISTIQKLAPIVLLSYIPLNSMFIKLLIFSSILSAMIGALGGLNLSSLRKIIAFSSINHLAWMLAAIVMSDSFWFTYFSIYFIILVSIISMLNKFQSVSLSDLLKPNMNKTLFSLLLACNLFSLSGLPPFLGFIPKWMLIQMLINLNFFVPLFFFLLSTLITLYFYLRLILPQLLLSSYTMNFNLQNMYLNSESMFLFFQTSMNLIGLILPIYLILI
uniref:NADH dehydrogenase subunit 2 n=1 Tax=Pinnotheres pholadis TaxID=2486895 RepID=UPI002028F35A|nr:NADH dehydrogenase subunit 2 [Pinnotheres pholadis]UPL64934.1 NADH dehydrogenase subunit 2 [Pinnotheres pholadis]